MSASFFLLQTYNTSTHTLIHKYIYTHIHSLSHPLCLFPSYTKPQTAMALSEPAEFGHPDFILLEEITEAAFMANLKLRYEKGKVYR